MKLNLTDKVLLEELYVMKFLRWWLTFIIIILPFQLKIKGFISPFNSTLSVFVGYLDELTVAVLLPLALFKIFMNKEYPIRLYGALLLPLVFLFIFGFVSGFYNGNSIDVTFWGTVEYIKNFLVLFVFAAFFQSYDEVNRIFNLLVKIALFLVAIALIQEGAALTSRYFLGIESYNISEWRLGIYRPASLMPSPNIFGLYILLIFILYLSIAKNINYFVFIFFILGILLCMSKMVYTGLIFLCFAQIYRKKAPFIYVLVPMVVLLITIFIFQDVDSPKKIDPASQLNQQITTYSDYREYTRKTAISIWKDHIFIGAGPGMFGGELSLEYKSKLYNEYSYSDKMKWYLKAAGNINQFWFQLLAEMGLLGVMTFGLFFIVFIAVLFILRIWASSYNIGNIFVGLVIITMTLLIFTTYTGLNNTSLMFTFSAIVGMAIGSEKEKYGYNRSFN